MCSGIPSKREKLPVQLLTAGSLPIWNEVAARCLARHAEPSARPPRSALPFDILPATHFPFRPLSRWVSAKEFPRRAIRLPHPHLLLDHHRAGRSRLGCRAEREAAAGHDQGLRLDARCR